VLAVASSKGIVAVDICHRSELARKLNVTGFLAGIETQVLKNQDVAVLQSCGFGGCIIANRVGRERYGLAQELPEALGGGCETHLRIRFTFGAPKVAHKNELSAAINHRLDRRKGHLDTSVVRNLEILIERDVEIDSHQYGLAIYIYIRNRLFRHR
jgi:hypothetical protein